jgi:1,4-alpha-glucan branching enzyme/maltooligosyltrehalose trehalohydrolase
MMLHHGPRLGADGTTFRLWAPAAKQVELMLAGAQPMTRDDDGWYSITAAGAAPGARYRFRIDGDLEVPDPASRFQPEDVAGPSEVIDHDAYVWQVPDWKGRPWHEAVVCEAHVGSFTAGGTYRDIIGKLDHLVETGFTALELMPLADYPGRRNWGYDGVLWYAPEAGYGRPDDLKALIDAAHARGLMVLLDVVYNHFGPDGNYLGRYAPAFFTDAHTPWGAAIDYTRPQVRAFAVDNALQWLRDYRFDGLRLDAVHAITVPGEPSVLQEISEAVGALARQTGRHIHLVLENDDNRAALLDPETDPPAGRYRAQWNDDYHHAWHVLLTGEKGGYYSDYAKSPLYGITRTLASGFAYQGEPSSHRAGTPRGEPSGALSPLAFVNFLQNHDQIGNRALGDRLEALAEPAAIVAALAITLLAPMPPMLFMGEEWGATQPFPFFCDFDGELADAIRAGRRREFESAYAKFGDDVPDPLETSTFESARIDWTDASREPGAARLKLVRELLAIRRREIVPLLAQARFGETRVSSGPLLVQTWRLGGRLLTLTANLSDQPVVRTAVTDHGRAIWGGVPMARVEPWAVHWGIA